MLTKVSYPSFGYPHQDSPTRKQLKNTRIGETGSHKIGKVGGLVAERKVREQLEIPGLKGSPYNWQEEVEGLGHVCIHGKIENRKTSTESLAEIKGGGQEDEGGKWWKIFADGFMTRGAVSAMLIPTSGEYMCITLTLYLILQS
jgi:hypothetical protein